MKNFYFLLFVFSFFFISFLVKKQNEKEQWLEYYGLKENMFHKGKEHNIELDWNYNYYDGKYKAIPDCYSSDSNYVIQHPFYGEPEEESLLVRLSDSAAVRLLYLSPGYGAEAVIWKNNHTFEIMGFQDCYPNFIPTIWRYNLKKNTCTVLCADTINHSNYRFRNK